MTGFYKDYADSSDTHQNSAEASADAAEVSANEAAASASEAATSASEAATSASQAAASLAAQEDLEVTSASFDTTDGTLTLTKANSGTVTTDLDGRYAELTGATFTGDVDIEGDLQLRDGDRIIIGDTVQDLYFSHRSDLGFGLVSEGTELRLRSPTVKLMSSTDVFLLGEDDTNGNPKVSLNYNNIEKLVTTVNGVTVSGDLLTTGNSVVSGNSTVDGDSTVKGSAIFQKGNFNSYPSIHHRIVEYPNATSVNGLYIDGEDQLELKSDSIMNLTCNGNLLRLYGSAGHKFLEGKLDGDSKKTTILYHGINHNSLQTVSDGILVDSKVEAELFKGDLEGAVHFKGAVASGATLTKGDVVYVSGHSGQKTLVDLADASDSSKMPAFGIVAADPVGGNVDVVTFGTLKTIDTSSYTDGDELFVSTTAGGLTATAPSGEGNLVQKIAKVVRADNSGNIKVMGAGRTNATPNLNDGNIFIGDSNNLATTVSFATQVASAETSHADVVVDGDFTTAGIMTTDGSGGYSVDSSTYATETYVDTAVSNLVDSAPATLDTLNELASALGDDANFSTTVTTSIGTKWTEDATKISNWDTSYSWGDHSTEGYLTASDITGKADLSGADFTGDVTTTGTLATGGYTLSSTDGTNGQALITDGNGNVSFSDVNVSVSGKADLSGANFTGNVFVEKEYPTLNDLLTTSRTPEELANWSLYLGDGAVNNGYDNADPNYRDALDVNQDANFSTADVTAVRSFVSNNYSSTDLATYDDIVFGTNPDNSTFVTDVLNGEYDTGTFSTDITNNRVGINTVNPNATLDVNGDIAVSGTVDGVDIAALDTSKANLSGANFTGNLFVEKEYPTVNDLLTTSRTIEELANWTRYVLVNDYDTTDVNYRDALDANQDGRFASSDWNYIASFVSNNYTATEYSTYNDIVSGTISDNSTFVTDVLNGEYDTGTLSTDIANNRVGINTVYPNATLDVNGDIAVSGTLNTNSIESTISSVDYPFLSTYQIASVFPAMTIGGTSTGNKVHTLEMRPAAGGVRMHWHQNTDNISGQTLRFHTTDRGVHVGDDRTGTYTAGDNQSNADIDFGMLVGRESSNLGSNNFGFGYDIDFSVDTASNLGSGSLIDVYEDTVNSVAFGGAVRLGKSVNGVESGVTASFVGGNISRTQGDYSFTWGKGELDENGIYPTVNEGYGCALFGHITEIDSDSNWCLAGGDFTSARNTSILNSDSSIAWGSGVQCSESNNSVVFGQNNIVYTADECLVSGKANAVHLDRCVVGGFSNTVGISGSASTEGYNSACFGASNLVEGNGNFVSGYDNNSLGNSGACIGRGLKTPLFQPVGGGDYVWDDYSVVVGGYNAEATKYYTNTNNTAWVEDHRFVVGTGTASTAKRNGFIVAVPTGSPTTPDFCGIIMPALASSTNYASATAAKAGGVPVGGLYRIGSDVKILLSTD